MAQRYNGARVQMQGEGEWAMLRLHNCTINNIFDICYFKTVTFTF
jgi:hypothetical protein